MSKHTDIIERANHTLLVERDLDAVEEFFTPAYAAHGTGTDITGLPAVRGFLKMLLAAFADLEVTVEALVESKDRIAWHRRCSGKQTGSFQGFPASGRQIVWRDMIVSRLENGQIAEEWVVTDLAEQLLRSRKG